MDIEKEFENEFVTEVAVDNIKVTRTPLSVMKDGKRQDVFTVDSTDKNKPLSRPLSQETSMESIFSENFKTSVALAIESKTIDKAQASNYDASAGEIIGAWYDNAINESPLGKAIRRASIDMQNSEQEDVSFTELNTFDYRYHLLESNGLPPSSANLERLKDAKNKDDFEFRLQTIRTDEKWKEDAAILTNTQRMTSGIVGTIVFDPTIFAAAPARIPLTSVEIFNRLNGTARLSSIVASNVGIQYGFAKMRDYGDPERSDEEKYIDMLFGGTIDSLFTAKAVRGLDEEFSISVATPFNGGIKNNIYYFIVITFKF